jgi:hypothetical protein
MKSEVVHGVSVPKIGFGTWRIGGDSYPNPDLDSTSLNALRTALEVGYTHFDTAEVYAAGHSEELLGVPSGRQVPNVNVSSLRPRSPPNTCSMSRSSVPATTVCAGSSWNTLTCTLFIGHASA